MNEEQRRTSDHVRRKVDNLGKTPGEAPHIRVVRLAGDAELELFLAYLDERTEAAMKAAASSGDAVRVWAPMQIHPYHAQPPPFPLATPNADDAPGLLVPPGGDAWVVVLAARDGLVVPR